MAVHIMVQIHSKVLRYIIGEVLRMDALSVSLKFSTQEDARSLTDCLEQLVRNLNLEPEEP